MPEFKTYTYPRIAPRSALYRVRANGQPITVLHNNVADFVALECDGEVKFEVEVLEPANPPLGTITVRPISRGITVSADAKHFAFTIPGPANLMIDVPGRKPLLLYANPIETNNPGERAGVRYFRAGQVYEVDELRLSAGEQLYVEGGAIVRGSIRAADADGLTLAGRGIVDGRLLCRRAWTAHSRDRELARREHP